jgi:hypothetical protein
MLQLLNINKRQILRGSGYSAQTPSQHSLSNRVLEKIDQEASRQKRSRSEYVELFFKDAFFTSVKH